MPDQGYLYSDAISLFHQLTGTQSTDNFGMLEGELAVEDSVNALLKAAERQVAVILYPHYREGKVPALNNLVAVKAWTQAVGGSVTQFQLPPTTSPVDENIFYQPISGYVRCLYDNSGRVSTTTYGCPLVFKDQSYANEIRLNPFAAPGNGQYLNDFVPVYFSGGYMVFFVAPYGYNASDNIRLTFYRMPKDPTSGTNSDLPTMLMEMTVYLMVSSYLSMDGDDFDLALQQVNDAKTAALLNSVIANLGFNPFPKG